jgi:2-keto-3-deoxy-6-phosphogluconate aldolase
LKPGLDAVGIGRGDLLHSLQTEPGQETGARHPRRGMQHPYIREAYEKVLAVANRSGIPLIDNVFGPEDAKSQVEMGIKILIYFIDQQLFYQICVEKVREVKKLRTRAPE